VVFGLENAVLNVKQGLKLNNENTELALTHEIDRLKTELRLSNKRWEDVSKDGSLGQNLLNELQSIYPQVSQCAFNRMPAYQLGGISSDTLVVLLLMTDSPSRFSDAQRQTIKKWAQRRINAENVMLFITEEPSTHTP